MKQPRKIRNNKKRNINMKNFKIMCKMLLKLDKDMGNEISF